MSLGSIKNNIFLLLICVACQNKESRQVTIFAAASTVPALEEIAQQLKSKQIKLVISGGPSSTIAQQIHRGAPCDLVLLADQKWMDFLSREQKIEEKSRVKLLKNRLVIVKHKFYRRESLPKRWIMPDPEHVPLGRYAKAALMSTNRWNSISSKLLLAPDARVALLWMERGEGEAAVLYASDARSSQKVSIVEEISPEYHPAIEYPLARCHSRRVDDLDRVYEFLRGARFVYRKYGFIS